eukprot:tig00021522_g22109.t1
MNTIMPQMQGADVQPVKQPTSSPEAWRAEQEDILSRAAKVPLPPTPAPASQALGPMEQLAATSFETRGEDVNVGSAAGAFENREAGFLEPLEIEIPYGRPVKFVFKGPEWAGGGGAAQANWSFNAPAEARFKAPTEVHFDETLTEQHVPSSFAPFEVPPAQEREQITERESFAEKKEAGHWAAEKASYAGHVALETAAEGAGYAAGKAKEALISAEELAARKASEAAHAAKEALYAAPGYISEKAYQAKEALTPAATQAAEKTKEVAGQAAEATKEVAGQASKSRTPRERPGRPHSPASAQAAQKTKEAASGAWETAGQAAQKTKETAAGAASVAYDKTAQAAQATKEGVTGAASTAYNKTAETAQYAKEKVTGTAAKAGGEAKEAAYEAAPPAPSAPAPAERESFVVEERAPIFEPAPAPFAAQVPVAVGAPGPFPSEVAAAADEASVVKAPVETFQAAPGVQQRGPKISYTSRARQMKHEF